ncbi:DAK2 domain-containing protein, partial [Streptomyces nanshensis]
RALRRAADSAYEAVAHPVEGTMLTVAGAAADAAVRHADSDPAAGAADVARAAHERSREALAETTGQLDVLRRAGVVDAGGSGLVAVLGALAGALEGGSGSEAEADGTQSERARPRPYEAPRRDERNDGGGDGDGSGGAYEVMYLLDADDAAVAALRERLDGMGDSLVVGGGDGLWSVHVHVDDAGAAVEAGLGAGRPHRIRVTHLASGGAASAAGGCRTAPVEAEAEAEAQPDAAADRSAPCAPSGRRGRAVVAVVHGDGLAGLCEEAGA